MNTRTALCILFAYAWMAAATNTTSSAQTFGEPTDVVFKSKWDGTDQRYVILLPQDFRADTEHDLMVALHGHGSDRWQFIKDSRDECLGTRQMAAARGMIYVSPDYRATTSWLGPAADADLVQILDELHGEFRIRDMVVCGGSMGGTSALAFAAMHPECVDGVVALNGTANLLEYEGFAEAISAAYGGSKSAKPEVYQQRSAELFPQRLTMPIATTTGGKDTLVPPSSVLRLAELLKKQSSPALSIHRPEGGHSTDLADTEAAFKFVFEQLDSKRAAMLAPMRGALEQETTLVCLGDSVTGVYYHSGGQRAYPEMLELALKSSHPNVKVRVHNAGISGHTAVDGLARLERDVLPYHPAIVTVSFGLNDVTRVPPEQFQASLEQIVDKCLEHESQVVLCTPNAVLETPDRPSSKLRDYCDIIRSVGRNRSVTVCDQYQAGERLRQRAPWTWRLTMSDAIHPNMDGHKRMAEELCRSITGDAISLQAIAPPKPALTQTRLQLSAGKPLNLLVMQPFAAPFQSAMEASLKQRYPAAQLNVSVWPTAGKSLSQLEQEAKSQVRTMKPDLVVLTLPANAEAESDDQFISAFAWLMNWSLSFGQREWDCIVIHPSVSRSTLGQARDSSMRQLVRAQHLELIDRAANDSSEMQDILQRWIETELTEPPDHTVPDK